MIIYTYLIMANRPKGSVLRTSVIQAKLTPQIHSALNKFAEAEKKPISTVVFEVLETKLVAEGYVESEG